MAGKTARSLPTNCGNRSPLALQKSLPAFGTMTMNEALPTALSSTKRIENIFFFYFTSGLRENC